MKRLQLFVTVLSQATTVGATASGGYLGVPAGEGADVCVAMNNKLLETHGLLGPSVRPSWRTSLQLFPTRALVCVCVYRYVCRCLYR